MICPKCKRKYEDDMPKCLWCDAPNPNYGKEEIPEQDTAPVVATSAAPIKKATEKQVEKPSRPHSHHKSKEPGLKIFWLALLIGFTGAHCSSSGRNLRGALYLIFGGLTYRIIYLILRNNGLTIPAAVCAIAFVGYAFIVFLFLKDVWKISLGKYRNRKTGKKYESKSWMHALALIFTIIHAVMLNFDGYSTYEIVWNSGERVTAKMELAVEDYMLAQKNYFEQTGKIGDVKEIRYMSGSVKWNGQFLYRMDGNGLRVKYMTSYHCPYKTEWRIHPVLHNGALDWEITLPEDSRCNEFAHQLVSLKESLSNVPKESEPAASTPELDKGVDGVGVVPDTTQHGDSL
ncbi:hypothetical protein SAMN05720472_2105 [Fibrobacter sp. UWR3]|uniref:hypothetical protein n=1 Tax=Fibrobacter sp. UWR3 TaxID=1896217 RepID=UPI00091FFCA7|nr:hypothetical protein [Fibrobacter sp. UWR3]SHM75414.1 hypothetical protein SAMN05720472_2105 [Fibrobacter sp. UWR3]